MKTSELTGAALDWTVAKCEGVGEGSPRFMEIFKHQSLAGKGYCYSRSWAQGGPIIEREWIELTLNTDPGGGEWVAQIADDVPDGYHSASGPTPLIAAMRCYVTFKLGDEIEVPKEIK
jgi:hypothetical protein